MNKVYDCIIIGAGPSGISCAIYLKRFNFDVLVIGSNKSALHKAHYIDNYYGISHISGEDLYTSGINQANSLGIEVIDEECVDIDLNENIEVTTSNKVSLNTYYGRKLYFGVGKGKIKTNITNIEDFEGKGVSYCATCDGFLYRKKRIGIVGDGDYMKSELEVLKRFTKDLYVFTSNENFTDDAIIIHKPIKSLIGENHLEGVDLGDEIIELDALFIAIGTQNSVTFAKHLGILLDDHDNIKVNEYKTNIDGIYAGGDCIGGQLQVAKAVYDGFAAAIVIKEDLKNDPRGKN